MDWIPCIIETVWTENDPDEQELWMDLEPVSRSSRKIEHVIPVYNHPHSDIENGQIEKHYHLDSRYVNNTYLQHSRISLPLKSNQRLEYRNLRKLHNEEIHSTPVIMISKSKMKHQCIHKNKCPHRGYDLSNETPINGVITCPLHSLQFNAITKQIINEEN